ncbi:MAG: hypothetical protein ABFS08_05850 [Pseudomonadota bacterium]
MKIDLPDKLRISLALTGAIFAIVGFIARGGVLSEYSILKYPLVIVLGIALFALGLYSPKYGFSSNRNDGIDSAPGASVGKQADNSNNEGGFGGGDG